MSAERQVAERLRALKDRIAAAARRAGREPAEVTLVGVSKRQPTPLAAAAVRAGLTHLGESFVQEARAKIPEVAAALGGAAPPPRWHLVGRLQRNKVSKAVGNFELIHSVASLPLAEAINRRARDVEIIQPVQVVR